MSYYYLFSRYIWGVIWDPVLTVCCAHCVFVAVGDCVLAQSGWGFRCGCVGFRGAHNHCGLPWVRAALIAEMCWAMLRVGVGCGGVVVIPLLLLP